MGTHTQHTHTHNTYANSHTHSLTHTHTLTHSLTHFLFLTQRRGFARSDDGGRSWAEVWYLADRQPSISRLNPTCAQALVSDATVRVRVWVRVMVWVMVGVRVGFKVISDPAGHLTAQPHMRPSTRVRCYG